MARIAVVHPDLTAKGGAEAVAMNVLSSLTENHDVTLITLVDPPLGALDDYYRTNTCSIEIELAGEMAPQIFPHADLREVPLFAAFLGRYAREHADAFDLHVSTFNEIGLGEGSIEYVHFPFDWQGNLEDPEVRLDLPIAPEPSRGKGHRVPHREPPQSRLIANSRWTAARAEQAYGIQPTVLPPPVDTEGFQPSLWQHREEGFVSIGRIEEAKAVHEQIEIVDAIRRRGKAVHLHIVGPPVDEPYAAEIEAMADKRDHVHFEGEVPRERVIDLVCDHRYGIHCRRGEHFGMAVAEIAAGGAIPFVPASGGQADIVNRDGLLIYHDMWDAVEKIAYVLDKPVIQQRLRERLGAETIRQQYGRGRFRQRFLSIVEEAVTKGKAATVMDEP